MKLRFLGGLAVALAIAAGSAPAQVTQYQEVGADGITKNLAVRVDRGLPVNCVTGCSAGSLSAQANAALQTSTEGDADDPLSMDLSRRLRTRSLIVDSTDTAISFSDQRPASSTITAADVGTSTASGQSSVSIITGTPTANSFQTTAIDGMASGGLTITGTFSATLQIEGSYNGGTTYSPISCLLRGSSLTTSSITGQAVLSCETAGMTHLRVRATSYTSGTATVQMAFSGGTGSVKLTNPLPAGSNLIGQANLAAAATGGCTVVGYQSAASTNATNTKASAGTLCGGVAVNTTATLYYLRLYNLASSPTCSSATGFVTSIPIPASTSGAGTLLNLGPFGADFATGLSFCLTGGGSSTDNTNAATGVYLTLTYK